MAGMTAAESSSPTSVPALLNAAAPQAIYDALIEPERAEFLGRYRAALAEAARSLDLTEVLAILDAYRDIARKTQQHGVKAHRRMLDRVEALRRGETVPTVDGGDLEALLGGATR